MSRKNRNARKVNYRPMKAAITGTGSSSSPTKNDIIMVDEKCGYEFVRLPNNILETDVSYQRPIEKPRVQKIVDKFDPRLVNPLKVSNRDGHFYVFDGAHTLAALNEVKKFDNFLVPCMLFHGLTFDDEARLFALQRGYAKEVAAAYKLNAMVLSKEEKAIDLKTRTEAAGFHMANSKGAAQKGLRCFAKLQKIHELSPDLYSDTLSLLMDCWHGEKWSLSANIVGGIALFLRVYGSEYNRQHFVKAVGAADTALLNKFKTDSDSHSKDFGFAYAMVKIYSKGYANKLDTFHLHEFKE